MDEYDKDKRVDLLVDEWGIWTDVEPGTNPGFLFQQNTMRDALVAGINLNIFNNHADRVKIANIAQMVNVLQSVILTKENQMVLTPTYYVFKMYNVHQDALMLPIEVKCGKYTSGSNAVDAISASASVKDGVVSITLCNLDPVNDQYISFDVQGLKFATVSGSIVTGSKINSYNDFGKKEEVTMADFKNAKINKGQVEASIPAKSVVLIQLK